MTTYRPAVMRMWVEQRFGGPAQIGVLDHTQVLQRLCDSSHRQLAAELPEQPIVLTVLRKDGWLTGRVADR
jgi:hypothetical protein